MRPLLTPRWLLRHAAVVGLVVAFGALARWQYSRATSGNTLSWAYTLEWPLFAGFVVAMWVRAVRDELRNRDPGSAEPGRPPIAARPPIATRPPIAARPPVVVGPAAGDPTAVGSGAADPAEPAGGDDPELAAYNRYLAWLSANPDRRPSDYPG